MAAGVFNGYGGVGVGFFALAGVLDFEHQTACRGLHGGILSLEVVDVVGGDASVLYRFGAAGGFSGAGLLSLFQIALAGGLEIIAVFHHGCVVHGIHVEYLFEAVEHGGAVDFYLVVAGKLLYGLQHLCANHGAAFGCFARRSCQCGLEGTQEFHFLLGSEVGALHCEVGAHILSEGGGYGVGERIGACGGSLFFAAGTHSEHGNGCQAKNDFLHCM